MNAEEQKIRHLAVAGLKRDLNKRIDDLAAAVDDEVREQFQKLRELIARLLAAEHAERVTAEQDADQTVQHVNLATISLTFNLSQFMSMSLAERLVWVATGRLPEHIASFCEDPEATILAGKAENEAKNQAENISQLASRL